MAHRRGAFRGRGISQSQRRKKSWQNLAAIAADANSSASFPNNTVNFDLAAGVPGILSVEESSLAVVYDPETTGAGLQAESTIIRIRGTLELEKNSVVTPSIITRAFGIGVMETQAALVGAFPNPASVLGALWDGWMFYRTIGQGALDANAGIVDVKSMRKLQSGQSLILVMGAQVTTVDDTLIGAPAISGFCTLRALMMLP